MVPLVTGINGNNHIGIGGCFSAGFSDAWTLVITGCTMAGMVACCVNAGYTVVTSVVALTVAGVMVGKLKVAATGSEGWLGARMDEAGDKLSAIRTASLIVLAGVAHCKIGPSEMKVALGAWVARQHWSWYVGPSMGETRYCFQVKLSSDYGDWKRGK